MLGRKKECGKGVRKRKRTERRREKRTEDKRRKKFSHFHFTDEVTEIK